MRTSTAFVAIALFAALVAHAHVVSVALYSESLCPYCAPFEKNFSDVYNLPGFDKVRVPCDAVAQERVTRACFVRAPQLLNYTQVVWGNAQLSSNDDDATITCQHVSGDCVFTVGRCGVAAHRAALAALCL
jgi:hypothetical protein